MRSASFGLLAAAGYSLVVSASWASLPEQRASFRSQTDLVRLPVRVVDNRTQRPITDLTQRDFTVRENGVLQTVSLFSSESQAFEGNGPATGGRTDRRAFLIGIGPGRWIEGPVHPFEGAIQFVRALPPDDVVAILSFNRATAFTNDHESVVRVLQQIRQSRDGIRFEMEQDWERSRFTNQDLAPAIQASIDKLFEVGDSPPRNLLTMLLGHSEARLNDWGWRPWNRLIAYTSGKLQIYAGIEHLRGAQGTKHLIYFFGGGLWTAPMIDTPRMPTFAQSLYLQDGAALAARANDAQVSLNLINTFGARQSDGIEILQNEFLTEQTGGRYTGVSTAQVALRQIDDATRHGYLIGYAPTNGTFDGKYRRIEVRVNRNNVTVMVARGYTARAVAPPVDLREVLTNQRLLDAATIDIAQTDIKIQASASTLPSSRDTGQIRVQVSIDPRSLTLRPDGSKRQGSIDVMFLCGNAKGELVCKASERLTIGMDDARYQQALSGGIPYARDVTVTTPPIWVKVLVYEYETDRLGATTARVSRQE